MADTGLPRLVDTGVVLCLALVASAVAGCSATRQLMAPPGDYSAYRATRVAKTVDLRLAAAVRYLQRYPEGDFAQEVSAYFTRTEPIFYAAKKDSAAGLSAYLRTLPRGPHAPEALEELRRLRAESAAPDPMSRAVAASGARLDREIARRVAVRDQIALWIGRFLDKDVWRNPLSDAPADLIVAWALGLPAPSCQPDHGDADPGAPDPHSRCSKLIELPYTVVVDGLPEPRQATIEITVIQDSAGKVQQMALGGPDLFLRIEETYAVRPIAPDNKAGRRSAHAHVIELVRREFEKRLSADPACERQAVAPVLLELACGGSRVRVSAGVDEGDDQVVLTPFDG